MDKLILGWYIPGSSVIHRLDPRSKLLAMFAFLLLIFANNLITNVLIIAFVFAMVLLSQIRLSFFINGSKPIIGIILFTTFFQVFFTPGASVLWEFWIFKVSIEGFSQEAPIIFIRFVLIIFFSTLLTLTTRPLSLADGIESGSSPSETVESTCS